jgi:hypothetical protein
MQRVAMAEGGAGAGGRTLGAVIREKDEELALFLQMRRRRGQEADLLLDADAAGDDDGLLLLDPPPPPPPHAGKKRKLRDFPLTRPFPLLLLFCSYVGAKTLAYPVWVYGAEPRAPAPAPAGYRMGAGFRRAPGGADDFLHSDAGDKSDYDW